MTVRLPEILMRAIRSSLSPPARSIWMCSTPSSSGWRPEVPWWSAWTTLVRQRWTEHLAGHADWHYVLWPVLMFQEWYAAQRLA